MNIKSIISAFLCLLIIISSQAAFAQPDKRQHKAKGADKVVGKQLKRRNALTKKDARLRKKKIIVRGNLAKSFGKKSLLATAIVSAAESAESIEMTREIEHKKSIRSLSEKERSYQDSLSVIPTDEPSSDFVETAAKIFGTERDDRGYTKGDRYEAFEPLAMVDYGFLKDIVIASEPLDNIDSYRITVNDNGNIIFSNSKKLVDTPKIGKFKKEDDLVKYTMNSRGEIYVFPAILNGKEIPHSSGVVKNVVAAGEIQVRNGRLQTISNESGHFQPSAVRTDLAIAELRSKGLTLKDSDFTTPNVDAASSQRARIGLTDINKIDRLIAEYRNPALSRKKNKEPALSAPEVSQSPVLPVKKSKKPALPAPGADQPPALPVKKSKEPVLSAPGADQPPALPVKKSKEPVLSAPGADQPPALPVKKSKEPVLSAPGADQPPALPVKKSKKAALPVPI